MRRTDKASGPRMRITDPNTNLLPAVGMWVRQVRPVPRNAVCRARLRPADLPFVDLSQVSLHCPVSDHLLTGHLCLFCHFKRVIYLDAEVPDCAFKSAGNGLEYVPRGTMSRDARGREHDGTRRHPLWDIVRSVNSSGTTVIVPLAANCCAINEATGAMTCFRRAFDRADERIPCS